MPDDFIPFFEKHRDRPIVVVSRDGRINGALPQLPEPSIMSDNSLGYQEQGFRFLFSDFFGVGAYVGRDKLWEVSWSWRHLSNAMLFPPNPGFDVPFTFSVGRVF